MKTVFLIHLFSTLFMIGVIWFAQAVHYPLLGRVGKEAFAAYEQENTRRTGWVVVPVMAVELATGLLLLWRHSSAPEFAARPFLALPDCSRE